MLHLAMSQLAKWCHWNPLGLRTMGGVWGAAPCLGEGMGRQAVGGQTQLRPAFSAPVIPSSPHLSRLQPYLPPTFSHLSQPLLALGFVTSILSLVRQAMHIRKDRQIQNLGDCNEQGWEVYANLPFNSHQQPLLQFAFLTSHLAEAEFCSSWAHPGGTLPKISTATCLAPCQASSSGRQISRTTSSTNPD